MREFDFGRGGRGGAFGGEGEEGEFRGLGRAGGRHGGREGAGRRGGFGHGGLRLVLLRLIADKPSHGYELIKAIEERSQGRYTPSPGVIYPALSWLEDAGFITIAVGEEARKQARITPAGEACLSEQAAEVERLFGLMQAGPSGGAEGSEYAPLFRAMHNLRAALRMRALRPLSKTEIETIVDWIDELARKIERL